MVRAVLMWSLLSAGVLSAQARGGARPSGPVIPSAAGATRPAPEPAPPAAKASSDSVPKGYEPPPGMCRVWVDGVPPDRQPAPTDCTTAVRNRPNNGRVIFGADSDGAIARAKRRLQGEDVDARLEQGPRRDGRRTPATDDEFLQRLQSGDICIDRNHDGRCDDIAAGSDGCIDANRDGRCDDARYDLNYIFGGAQGGSNIPPGAQTRSSYGGPPSGEGGFRMGSVLGSGPTQSPGLGNVFCFDRNHDGRCDEPWSDGGAYPQTLPEMDAVTRLRRGEASYDLQRWLRRTDLVPRIVRNRNSGPNGAIERVTWLDQNGDIVQVWTDRDLDGIADRVEIYAAGRRVQLIER
ncbi:MAG: hypothetical protein SFW08_00855 [Gemmatimonadaceae bacterium]|nr:hypothetical protein [Gemmatimonadaceae bacterium]